MSKMFAGLTSEGWKAKKAGLKYSDIPEHYKRKNWMSKEAALALRKVILNQNMMENAGQIKTHYTDRKTVRKRDVQIEHKHSMFDAFLSGAYKWLKSKKQAFAKDMENIVTANKNINIQKGAKNITEWLPSKNVQNFLSGIENTKVKWELTGTKKEAKVFKKLMGRKPKFKIGPKVQDTPYCTRCHISHSINQHKK